MTKATMKFAHFSHVWNKPAMTAHQRFANLMEEIKLADEAGLDVIGIGEHHRPDYAAKNRCHPARGVLRHTQTVRIGGAKLGMTQFRRGLTISPTRANLACCNWSITARIAS